MAERLHPGVYVEEVSSGSRPIEAAGTSTAAFVGEAARGQPGYAHFLTKFDDYTAALGGHLPDEKGFLAQAIQAFFLAGGQRAYAVRVLPKTADRAISSPVATRVPATLLPSGTSPDALRFLAKGAGAWANALRIDISDSLAFPGQAFSVVVSSVDGGGITTLERYPDVRMDPSSEDYFPDLAKRTSRYIEVEDLLLADSSSATPAHLPIPERAPVLALGAATHDATGTGTHYTVYDGTALTFRWTSPSDDAQHATTVTFNAAALPAAKSFLNGRVDLTPLEVAKILKTGLGAAYRVAPDPDAPSPPTNVPPSVTAPVATRAYLFLSLHATTASFDFTGLAVNVSVTTGATTQAFPLPTNLTTLAPVDLANAINALAIPGVTASARGRAVMIAGSRATADTSIDLTGVTATTFDKLAIAGHGGALVDHLDPVELTVSEAKPATAPSFLRTLGMSARARGFDEGSAASAEALPATRTRMRLDAQLGTDGAKNDVVTLSDFAGDASTGTGLHALDHVDVNLVALPGKNSPEFITTGMSYCDARQDCFFIADGPGSIDRRFSIDAPEAKQFVEGLPDRSENSAIYFPWIEVPDPVGVGRNPTRLIPPSGAIAGVFARTDVTRGVWKAPAGIDAGVSGALDVQVPIEDGDQDLLNPVSLNCIRRLSGAGIVTWGARTLAADPEWRYVPVRRTAIFLKESLKRGLRWAVFQPNDEPLWDQIKSVIGSFMLGLFRQGAFQGSKPDDAFAVTCDRSTNPQELVDQGIVTAKVAFAPLKPAEFVVIEISQKSLVA